MLCSRTNCCFILMVAVAILQTTNVLSQNTNVPINTWVEQMDSKDFQHKNLWSIKVKLDESDSAESLAILNELEKAGSTAGYRFRIRMKWLRAYEYYDYLVRSSKESDPTKLATINNLLKSALYEAYGKNDNFLAAQVSRALADMNLIMGNVEEGMMYSMNTIELANENDSNYLPIIAAVNRYIGNFFFHNGDHATSVIYINKAIEKGLEQYEGMRSKVSLLNTLALNYVRTGLYDKSKEIIDEAKALARQTNDTIWMAILAGTEAEYLIQQKNYDKAILLLDEYYTISTAYKEYANTANALQLQSTVYNAKKDYQKARSALHQAIGWLYIWPHPAYELNVYRSLYKVLEDQKQTDSAYYYYKIYSGLHEKRQMEIATSRISIARIKSDHERSLYRIKSLQNEKDAAISKRNLVLIMIISLAIISGFLLNRQRLKLKLKDQKAKEVKLLAQADINAAKDKMELFRESLVEKTTMIVYLQDQLETKLLNEEKLSLLERLSDFTILTEEDWYKFKSLFEKIYPGFFMQLKTKAPDITEAEQRMAALTRLHLTTRQIAAILGISTDSVHKSRQRLRHRLNIQGDVKLESSLASI